MHYLALQRAFDHAHERGSAHLYAVVLYGGLYLVDLGDICVEKVACHSLFGCAVKQQGGHLAQVVAYPVGAVGESDSSEYRSQRGVVVLYKTLFDSEQSAAQYLVGQRVGLVRRNPAHVGINQQIADILMEECRAVAPFAWMHLQWAYKAQQGRHGALPEREAHRDVDIGALLRHVVYERHEQWFVGEHYSGVYGICRVGYLSAANPVGQRLRGGIDLGHIARNSDNIYHRRRGFRVAVDLI